MADLTQCTLDDVLELQRGHDLPATIRGSGNVPVIGSFGVTGFHNVAKYAGPGVAIGRSGASIGVATYCASEYWPLNTCLFVKDFRDNDPRWVYYLLDSIDFTGFNSGSAQPSLNRNYLKGIPVVLPEMAEQRAIAGLLGALDDKIGSNRRLRGILARISYLTLLSEVSEILQTSDGENGRAEGLPLHGSDLRIVETGFRNDPGPRSFTYLATADVSDNEYRIGEFGSKEELPSRANMEPGFDRCWFARMKATPKWLWTPSDYSEEWESLILSTGFLGIEASDSRLSPIVMTAIRTPEFQIAKDQLCNGTTMQSLNNDSAGQLVIRVPSDQAVVTRLSEDLRANLLLEHQLNIQSMRLIKLREVLLPELMSGRLRVKDAESMMENV